MRVYGGGRADQLPARGELGSNLKALVEGRRVTLVSGFCATKVRRAGTQVVVIGETALGERALGPVDRIVIATEQRPDLSLARELRLDLDPWLESAKALAPLIDPNLHSCGSVAPHRHRELAHPEPSSVTVGIKSYGRAPTFLMLAGYEQVRPVIAAIAGDMAEADTVHLGPARDRCRLGELAGRRERGMLRRTASGQGRRMLCRGRRGQGSGQGRVGCAGDPAPRVARRAVLLPIGMGHSGMTSVVDTDPHVAAPDVPLSQARLVWALGLTQIVGYGTLYYSFSVLAADMARDLIWSVEWVYGAFSVALLLGGMAAPWAGRLVDGRGAGGVMAWGSAAVALALAATAFAPERLTFVLGLVAVEAISTLVLYDAAFAAVVQVTPATAKRTITHLTLIGGFASTVFWPATSALHAHLDWREVYLVFAALNLGLCAPIHLWVAHAHALLP